MSYWKEREKYRYYEVVRRWLDDLGHLGSLADVGCCDTPVATWGAFDQRWTVDTRQRPAMSGVVQIVGLWPDCAALLPTVDVVTCLQVLEHIAEPEPFTAALFASAREAVILSVPYRWPAGRCKWHVQDPVDEAKLRGWTHREPTQQAIVCDGGMERLVAIYEISPLDPYGSLLDEAIRRAEAKTAVA